MIAHVLLCCLLCVNTACDSNIEKEPEKEPVGNDYELVWTDEFDEPGLPDAYYWGYDEGYCRNNELQDYKKANSKYARVEDGKLIIEAHKDPHDGVNPWTGEPYHFEYSSAELRLQATNLFTIADKKWKGFDPETNGANIPTLPTYSLPSGAKYQ